MLPVPPNRPDHPVRRRDLFESPERVYPLNMTAFGALAYFNGGHCRFVSRAGNASTELMWPSRVSDQSRRKH